VKTTRGKKDTLPKRHVRAPAAKSPRAGGADIGAGLGVAENEIYERIHEAMLDHRLEPGTKLKEVALAELFAVNRSVIRRVLVRLAHSKLVVLRPNRGAVVASPTVQESRHLYAARRAIEGAIVDTLVSRITKEQIRELRALVKREQEAYRAGEMNAGLKLSLQFHRAIADMAGNTVLAEFLEQLVARTPLIVLAYKGTSFNRSCSNDEHSRILDAIAAGDADQAVAVMKSHLQSLESQLDLHEEEEQPTDLAEIFGVRR
jgi:DNA-binding GntR family transcriptional regulator